MNNVDAPWYVRNAYLHRDFKMEMFTVEITVFARVICALFFSILAAEKSKCVKYVDFFCAGLDLGFILV